MKIGILLPRSGEYPFIAIELMEGLRAAAGRQEVDILASIVSGNIGFGESEKVIYTELERLFLIENADVVLAYIDTKVMPLIEPLVYASGKLLIVLNAGANLPAKGLAAPGIIYLTLQQSFMCALTGKAAGDQQGVFVSSFYDCGYLHGFALVDGFTKSGGEIIYNFIDNKKKNEHPRLTGLPEFLTGCGNEAPALLCIFDEAPAAAFYAELNSYEKAGKLNLFVSPMMLTEKAINGGNYKFSIKGYTSWLPQIENVMNQDFLLRLNRPIKNSPGIFLLSGFLSGLLLTELMKADAEILKDHDGLSAYLATVALPAPGGALRFDRATGFFISDTAYRCELLPGESVLRILPETKTTDDWQKFTETIPDGADSGWINTYLCY